MTAAAPLWWYYQRMRCRRLFLAASVAGASVAAAQVSPTTQDPKPCTPTDLTLSFARAMPYRTFLATDTTAATFWAAANERAEAAVATVMKASPPPAGAWKLLVVAENSCSDALASLPYLARLVDRMPGSELRILRKADAPALLDAHPFQGRSATPLVLVLDSESREQGAWIERASHIQAFVTKNEGKMPDDSLWARVRVMRRADDGRTPMREVIALMREVGSPAAAAPGRASRGKQPVKLIEPCKVPPGGA